MRKNSWIERTDLHHRPGVWQQQRRCGRAVVVGNFYGGPAMDLPTFTSYHPALYAPDSEQIISTYGIFTKFEDAEAWFDQVDHGEIQPVTAIRYGEVPLAIGSRVSVVNGGLNERYMNTPGRRISGKMATVTSQHHPNSWYVQVDGEEQPERFSLRSDPGSSGQETEIEASYYLFSPGPKGEPEWKQYEHDRAPWVQWLHPTDGGSGPTLQFLNYEAFCRFDASNMLVL